MLTIIFPLHILSTFFSGYLNLKRSSHSKISVCVVSNSIDNLGRIRMCFTSLGRYDNRKMHPSHFFHFHGPYLALCFRSDANQNMTFIGTLNLKHSAIWLDSVNQAFVFQIG